MPKVEAPAKLPFVKDALCAVHQSRPKVFVADIVRYAQIVRAAKIEEQQGLKKKIPVSEN